MLKSMTLCFGSSPGQPPLTCVLGAVTVLVGPNNSGKSKTLMELEQTFRSDNKGHRDILRSVELGLPQSSETKHAVLQGLREELGLDHLDASNAPQAVMAGMLAPFLALDLLQKGKLVPERLQRLWGDDGQALSSLEELSQSLPNFEQFDLKQLAQLVFSGGLDKLEQSVKDAFSIFGKALNSLREQIRQHGAETVVSELVQDGGVRLAPYAGKYSELVLFLNGHTRLELVRPTSAPDLRHKTKNHLSNLWRGPVELGRLRKAVYEAFKLYLAIDITRANQTRLVLSPEPPGDHERSTTPESLAYFDAAQDIMKTSDGVKSFVGLLCAILSDSFELMLIDEPEAFLHPPLARRLGQELHALARDRKAKVVAATHSPEFLMGCLQAGTDVSVVRLTYRDQQATARQLPAGLIQQISRDPLLRSSDVVDALFHEGAVVVESDADRAFYEEINERLLAGGEGAAGTLFLNAQNKQTVERIVAPLRKMGIPAAAIIDLDAVADSSTLRKLLVAINADPAIVKSIALSRTEIMHQFEKLAQSSDAREPGRDEKPEDLTRRLIKQQGLRALEPKQRCSFEGLLAPLEAHGIFLVPHGELECWLPHLASGVRNKSGWLTTVFDAMGADPTKQSYVRPGPDDVWDFMRKVARWISNPTLGMPA